MEFIKENHYIVVIAYVAVMSLITAMLYVSDKVKAKKGGLRVPEKVLLLCSILGGAIGGYAAMLGVRHKTKGEHWYFTAVNLLGIVIWVAVIVAAVMFL